MALITGSEVVAKASAAAFGKPLVTNNLRALLVEAMIAAVLPDGWTWCSSDWAGWDFEHADGTRLEVKQAAAWQSWSTETSAPSHCSFDIAARTGYWQGAVWVARPERHAHLYVLAHHPVVGRAADHREPDQWHFFVVAARDLPQQSKTIALSKVRALTTAGSLDDLPQRVEVLRASSPMPVACLQRAEALSQNGS